MQLTAPAAVAVLKRGLCIQAASDSASRIDEGRRGHGGERETLEIGNSFSPGHLLEGLSLTDAEYLCRCCVSLNTPKLGLYDSNASVKKTEEKRKKACFQMFQLSYIGIGPRWQRGKKRRQRRKPNNRVCNKALRLPKISLEGQVK